MKIFKMLFVVCGLVSLTGCLDMVEEMTLNKDGSGKYALTFDMGGIMTDPMMKGMMEQMMAEQENVEIGPEGLEQDTTIYFKDSPEMADLYNEKPEFWDKVRMHTVMSESKKEFFMTMEFEFKSIDDVNYFYENLQEIGENNQMGGGFLPLGGKGLFSLKKKQLVRAPVKADSKMEESEEMQMAKMFFTNSTYKTIYHLPGKPKKSTIPNATFDGNTVTVSTSLLDIMDGKAQLDGTIKYK